MDAVVFQVGRKRCALELLQVAEVVSLGPIAEVPRQAPALIGAMNLRGQIVAVLDAGTLLGVPDPPPMRANKLGLLVQTSNCRAVLCVDRVEGVLPIEELGSPTPALLELEALFGEVLAQLEAERD